MNCGPHRDDPRSAKERKLLCDECRGVTPSHQASIKLVPLTGYGQVREGDVLLVKRSNEYIAPVEVKEVIDTGTDREEIILSKAKNVYFVVAKFLRGDSWIKECSKLVDGRLYSITNNQRDITCYRDDARATAQEEGHQEGTGP